MEKIKELGAGFWSTFLGLSISIALSFYNSWFGMLAILFFLGNLYYGFKNSDPAASPPDGCWDEIIRTWIYLNESS